MRQVLKRWICSGVASIFVGGLLSSRVAGHAKGGRLICPKTKKERQPGESTQAFEAFRTYRDLGLKRSNKAVSDTLSKSRQLISRWKATWNWDERVRAYDTALEREAHKEAVKNLKDMTSPHIKIAVQLQNKALEALQRVKVEDMSPRDIREYIKLATDLERLNRSSAATDNELEAEETTSVDIYMPEKEEDSHE